MLSIASDHRRGQQDDATQPSAIAGARFRAPALTGPPIAICIPARDEAGRLPQLFAAIDRLQVPAGSRITLCLLLDGCSDASLSLATAYRSTARHRVVTDTAERAAPNAGRARDAAMRLGMAAVGQGDAILLSSDADSVPAPDWIRTMAGALAHADVVAGDVVRGGNHPDQDRIERHYARLFALRRQVDPVPWEATVVHHHASGANMGLRAATYVAAGGFLPLASGEDARFVDDAARAGLRVRRDAASIVHTSDRRAGRVHGGLATMLCDLDRDGLTGVSVAHPADQLWQYRLHAVARRAFAKRDWHALSVDSGLDPDHLLGVARDVPNAEAFAMRVVPVPPGGMRHVPFVAAEAALAALTAVPAAA